MISNVVDTVSAAGTALGLAVATAVGASWYLQTTDELERTVKARQHAFEQLRDTPLEKAADAAFENLLEFRGGRTSRRTTTSTRCPTSCRTTSGRRRTCRTRWCSTWTTR